MVDPDEITREEFVARFKAEMLKPGPTFEDGSSVAAYAESTAASYWDEPDQRADGPEECARTDMSYWGD